MTQSGHWSIHYFDPRDNNPLDLSVGDIGCGEPVPSFSVVVRNYWLPGISIITVLGSVVSCHQNICCVVSAYCCVVVASFFAERRGHKVTIARLDIDMNLSCGHPVAQRIPRNIDPADPVDPKTYTGNNQPEKKATIVVVHVASVLSVEAPVSRKRCLSAWRPQYALSETAGSGRFDQRSGPSLSALFPC
jgi:hypothetical protein